MLSNELFLKKVSYEKFHDIAFIAREIVDDCPQSVSPRISCSFETTCLVFIAKLNFENNS